MKKAIAIFDIDGTLLPNTTAERLFFRYLSTHEELGPRVALNYLGRFLSTFLRDWDMATRGNRFYLKGKSVARIREHARTCFRESIVPRISEVGRRKLEDHRAAGFEIVLLSGTLDVLLHHFQDHLQTDHAHGSVLGICDGRYTGHLVGLYPIGKAKAEIVRALYGGDAYDLSASYAYADHPGDMEFLSLLGHPHVVNPSSHLASKAKSLGFDITHF